MVDFPEGFDLEALLAPIPGDAPQGIDIREDFSSQSPYSKLRDARSDARDAEKMIDNGDPDAPDPAPLWRAVRELGVKVLQDTAKDLEVAAWVTEAYVRSHGLRGLTAGASLIKGLAEEHWDGVFPLPDDYGVETRVGPVGGLNGRDGGGSLIQPLYKLPLFDRPDGTPITFFTYQASEQLPSLPAERRDARIAAGAIPYDDMERDARAAAPRLAAMRNDATAALEAWEGMAAVLDEKASEDPPSTSHVRDMLRQIKAVCLRYAPEAAAAGEEMGGEEMGGVAVAGEAGGGGGGGGGGPGLNFSATGQRTANREDALKTLETIASYFRTTEPNSPLSYTLDDAVRRAKLTWPELLEECVPDFTTRQAILTALGIRVTE
jgi:type VI secretion system protein ImpA